MKNIVPYKLFEAVKKIHPDGEEFAAELEKFPYKDVLTSWIKFTPRNTGRVTFSGHFIPSNAYIEKSANGQEWYYVYAAAGNYYGHQNGSLQQLFPKMMKDFIKKGAPSYLNKKDLELILNDDEWFFANVEPDYRNFYKKVQEKINSGSGIILDFSDLDLPVLDSLADMGFITVGRDGNYGELTVSLIGSPSRAAGKDFWKMVSSSVESYSSTEDLNVSLSKFSMLIFYPKGSGVSPRGTNERMRIDIGFATKEEASEAIQKTLLKYMLKNKIVIKSWGRRPIPSELVDSINALYHSMIKGAADSASDTSHSALDDYFKKNPLDLYILNSVPKIKAGVLKRTGIRDLSRTGDILSRNLF